MRGRILLHLLLLSFAITSVISQSSAQGGRNALLQIFDVQPSPQVPLALDDGPVFHFNRRVNCADAEAAFYVTPAIRGELKCDQFSLRFTPVEAYERNKRITFALRPPLSSLDGAPMLDPFEATYTTAGYLAVSEVFPSGRGGAAPVDSVITVAFDRPVAPLTLPSAADELPQPLTIHPLTAGRGEWVNSAVYTFTPATPLTSGQTYRVSVASDIEAQNGDKMKADYVWTFETAEAAIVSIDPPPGATGLGLTPKIQVRFNQVMDQLAVESAFFLRPLPGRDDGGLSGSFAWADDGRGFAFTPDARLKLDSFYEAGYSPGLALAPQSWRYQSVPEPGIVATEPADGAHDVARGGFSLFFASTMNIETLRDRIVIEPEPAAPPRFYYSEWANRYTVSFDAAPSTAYTVRIAPGMKDIYGNAIAAPTVFHYTTAARTPLLSLHVPGPVGFYNAHSQPTRLYAQHRGVETIDFALYRAPLLELVARLTQADRYVPAQDYEPSAADLLKKWRVKSDAPEMSVEMNRWNFAMGVGGIWRQASTFWKRQRRDLSVTPGRIVTF